jgi:hypothetical protein
MKVNASNIQKSGLEETEIEEVESFVYLGSVVSENGGTEEDVVSRIKKANGVFVQLYSVWRNHNITKGVKIRIRKLQVFVNKCLRRIMKIKLTDKITNELWRITQQKSIENQIKRRQ